jgi:hypothetical protein
MKPVARVTVCVRLLGKKKKKKQVMVLMHEKAQLAESMPYFSCRLAPLKANIFFGRSSKLQPATPAMNCVYDWFKDPVR